MNYEGTLYRPPSEAYSLIVQVTIGCSNNRCTFCTMYKDKSFRIRDKSDVIKDFQNAYEYYGDNIRRIFLADGDALVVKTPDLMDILSFIHDKFPSLERITSYGTPLDVLKKSERELKALKSAGLDMVYMGAESGDDETLVNVRKNASSAEIINAGKKLKDCGIKSSITLISGLGGKKRKVEHAIASARLISEIKPEYVGFLTLMLDHSSQMYNDVRAGKMELLNPSDVADEMRLFLKHVDSPGTVFRSNHASNYVSLKGTLNDDIPNMLSQLDTAKEKGMFRLEYNRSL